MRAPDWLTARPVAHRGLHDAAHGVIENTPSSVTAAIAANYAIEVDLQITADGEAMVHHDEALGRLTDGRGALNAIDAAELRRVAFKTTSDHMISLGELCELVAGRVTLVLELKSHFDDDRRLPMRVVEVLRGYSGPVAVDVVRSRPNRGNSACGSRIAAWSRCRATAFGRNTRT